MIEQTHILKGAEGLSPDAMGSLLDAYAFQWDMEAMRCKYMGLLLDEGHLAERIQKFRIQRAYIYGAGFLGLQLYRGLQGKLGFLGMADRGRRPRIPMEGLAVLGLEELRDAYGGEHLIVTPLEFFREIREELAGFVPEGRILFVGEFLEGLDAFLHC